MMFWEVLIIEPYISQRRSFFWSAWHWIVLPQLEKRVLFWVLCFERDEKLDDGKKSSRNDRQFRKPKRQERKEGS